MISAVLSIIPNLVGQVSDYFKHKRELKQAVQVKKLEAVQQGQAFDASWEQIQAANSNESWKDEFALVCLFAPIILASVGYPEYAQRAFEAFAVAPDWYQNAFLVGVGASFGVKLWKTAKA